jgi:hypothetical protein
MLALPGLSNPGPNRSIRCTNKSKLTSSCITQRIGETLQQNTWHFLHFCLGYRHMKTHRLPQLVTNDSQRIRKSRHSFGVPSCLANGRLTLARRSVSQQCHRRELVGGIRLPPEQVRYVRRVQGLSTIGVAQPLKSLCSHQGGLCLTLVYRFREAAANIGCACVGRIIYPFRNRLDEPGAGL